MKKRILLLAPFIVLSIVGCESDKSPACNSTTFPMTDIFSSLAGNGFYTDEVSYDTEIHEYKFILDTDGEICSIGFQAQASSGPFEIEILNDSSQVVFSDSYSFSSSTTDYIAINPLPIVANREYTIRRINANYTMSDEIIGRILTVPSNDSLVLPISAGIMTMQSHLSILGSTSIN